MRSPIAATLAVLALLLASACADGRRAGYGAPPPMAPTDAALRTADAGVVWGDDAASAGPDAAMPSSPLSDAGTDAPPSTSTVLPGVPALRCGRTYDHESSYLVRAGAPDFASMRHRDGTSLPAEEGGTSCDGRTGCDENVTLLCDGDSLTGVLENAASFSVQGALSGEPGTGSLVITLGGRELPSMPYASTSTTLPGFVNGPQPAAPVPSLERTEVEVRATGGCVWVRAVTVECPAGTLPNQPR